MLALQILPAPGSGELYLAPRLTGHRDLNLLLETTTEIQARSLRDGEWSPLTKDNFASANPPLLRVSEVHYHPSDPTAAEQLAGYTSAGDFEFVELVNIGDAPLDLSSYQLIQTQVGASTQGISFDFSAGSQPTLAAGERLLVVANRAAFAARYGSHLPVAGSFVGALSNNREQITLVQNERIVQQMTYDDDWYPSTDGGGPSLEIVDATAADLGRWSLREGWRPSGAADGTPGSHALEGDLTADGERNADDIDALTVQIRAAARSSAFDLNDDQLVDTIDLEMLVRRILGTEFGDANLDGVVDVGDDGESLLTGLGSRGSWATGDFDGDGFVTASQDGALLLEALASDSSSLVAHRLDALFATWQSTSRSTYLAPTMRERGTDLRPLVRLGGRHKLSSNQVEGPFLSIEIASRHANLGTENLPVVSGEMGIYSAEVRQQKHSSF